MHIVPLVTTTSLAPVKSRTLETFWYRLSKVGSRERESLLLPYRLGAPCGLRGCKNGPTPFPGRMSYKATEPGLVSVLYLSMFFIVLVFIKAPFMYC